MSAREALEVTTLSIVELLTSGKETLYRVVVQLLRENAPLALLRIERLRNQTPSTLRQVGYFTCALAACDDQFERVARREDSRDREGAHSKPELAVCQGHKHGKNNVKY